MTFDEQPDDPDPHGQCAHEIHALQERIRELEQAAKDWQFAAEREGSRADDWHQVADDRSAEIIRLATQLAARPVVDVPASEPVCENCNGSGSTLVMTYGRGPDDYEQEIQCPSCGGTGASPVVAAPQEPAKCQCKIVAIDTDTGTVRREVSADCALHNGSPLYAAPPAQDVELRRDAARYRWLRENAKAVRTQAMFWNTSGGRGGRRQLDVEIDAAIAAIQRQDIRAAITGKDKP